MNLREFTAALPKPWLDIKANTLVASGPRVVAIGSDTFANPQNDTNVLTNLAPGSSSVIPKGSPSGSVYRFFLRVNGTCANPGDTALINIGTLEGGLLFSFPIIAPSAFADVPITCQVDLIITNSTTVNLCGSIFGYIGGPPPVSTGFAFCSTSVPMDTTIDQTLTCTYTSNDFTSATFTERLFYKLM